MSAIDETPAPAMSNFASRILVGLVGLPVVLGLLWLGGWWLFGLVAIAGVLALHEFYRMTRPLRPLAIAGFAGLLLLLLGLQLGGLDWATGSVLLTLALSFL